MMPHSYLVFASFYSLAFLIGVGSAFGLAVALVWRGLRKTFRTHMDAAVQLGEIDEGSARYAVMVFDGICPLNGSPRRVECDRCGAIISPGVEPVAHCTCDDCIETQWPPGDTLIP